ncbi:MAG: type VI secretion system Vgr family protein, partial [Rhodanobacter sp.]
MDITEGLTAVSAALANFSDATRLYGLEGEGPLAHMQVERWSGTEALSRCYSWTIDVLSTNANLSLDDMLGQRAALRTTLADGSRSARSGLVCEASCLGSDGGMARYRLTLSPWLWMLDQGRHSRVFQDQSVLEIAAKVFVDYAPHASWKVTADAHSLLSQVRPRSYAVQYRETDLAFLERLLVEEGLGYTFVEDAEASAGHTLLIFADSAQLPEDVTSSAGLLGRGIRYHRTSAVEISDTIQAMGQDRALVPDAVTVLSNDYKTLSSTAVSVALKDAHGQREAYDAVGPYAFANEGDAQHYANLLAQAHEAQQARWEGRGSVRTARAGTRFQLSGTPWAGLPGAGNASEFVWTELWHAGINNLPESLQHAVLKHLGAAPTQAALNVDSDISDDSAATIAPALWQQAEATGYAQHFSTVARSTPWRPTLDDEHGVRLNPRPTTPGVQTAIVVGPEGETSPGSSGPLYTDKLGRLKVRFHWQRSDDHGSCWLRATQRYAGAGHGAQFLPRIGQEVLVSFMGGDIDRPIIVGALYNGHGEGGIAPSPGKAAIAPAAEGYAQAADFQPSNQANLAGGNSPAWHGLSGDTAGHANAAALSGIKTQGFDGNGYNQLVMDDTDQQGRVQFASTQATSQLNLGHIIHQGDDYRGSFR